MGFKIIIIPFTILIYLVVAFNAAFINFHELQTHYNKISMSLNISTCYKYLVCATIVNSFVLQSKGARPGIIIFTAILAIIFTLKVNNLPYYTPNTYRRVNVGLDNPLSCIHPIILIFAILTQSGRFYRIKSGVLNSLSKQTNIKNSFRTETLTIGVSIVLSMW